MRMIMIGSDIMLLIRSFDTAIYSSHNLTVS